MLQFISVMSFFYKKVVKPSLPEIQKEMYVSVLMRHKLMVQNSFLGKDS